MKLKLNFERVVSLLSLAVAIVAIVATVHSPVKLVISLSIISLISFVLIFLARKQQRKKDQEANISSFSNEEIIKTRSAMRDKIRSFYSDGMSYLPRALIISEDSNYPEAEINGSGPDSWYTVNITGILGNNLEVIADNNLIGIPENGKLKIVSCLDVPMSERSEFKYVRKIGLIPLENIIQFDEDSDGIENKPRFYCKFIYDGMPFKEYRFEVQTDFVKDGIAEYASLDANEIISSE